MQPVSRTLVVIHLKQDYIQVFLRAYGGTVEVRLKVMPLH